MEGATSSGEGIELNVTLEASNTLSLNGLDAAGLGITIYPESLIGFLGRIVEVRQITQPAFRSKKALVWKRSDRSPQVEAFVQVSKQIGLHGSGGATGIRFELATTLQNDYGSEELTAPAVNCPEFGSALLQGSAQG